MAIVTDEIFGPIQSIMKFKDLNEVITGLTLTGTVVGLVFLTPVLIFFSPILILMATMLFVAVVVF